MKTDPDLDQKAKDLVEWMDEWSWREINNYGSVKLTTDEGEDYHLNKMWKSLDLVRELEVAVIANFKLACSYRDKLKKVIYERQDESLGVKLNLILADTKDRLIALHRTLDEAGEL